MELDKTHLLTDVTPRHGNQGILDTASKGSLESEFGTSKDDDVVKQILEKGNVVESGVSFNPDDDSPQLSTLASLLFVKSRTFQCGGPRGSKLDHRLKSVFLTEIMTFFPT